MRRLGRGPCEDSRAEEKILEMIKFAFEEDDVEGRIESREIIFDVLRDEGMFEHPAERGFGLVILSGELTAKPRFSFQLHDGEKEVGVETETSIE